MHRIGFHVSVAQGFLNIFENAKVLGANCCQIFTHSPRSWAFNIVSEDVGNLFKDLYQKEDIKPVIVHDSYLPNLASIDPIMKDKSIDSIKKEFISCNRLGLEFLNIHPGAHKEQSKEKGLLEICESLNSVKDYVGKVTLLFENTSGSGSVMGSTFEELKFLLENTDFNCGITLDTCHLFTSGYDISNREALENTVSSFDKIVGLENLKLIHLNDSQGELNSKKDRHEHIGLGKIGPAGFKAIVNHDYLKNIPMIMETPVNEKRGDKENIIFLREMIEI
ncbi:MAG: endonuclease IV [Candidatus Methanofastidiosum methylothiophilum]|uniref:Probable endonuclease 4 n=1 Tax=Candidatus Methanofastidiosum methylothiophilum TaxID=1705564 RepID=A0A150J443_9EURY|nr:MAG: endonuclease IV [Candidatus Methanofastidiosum methylthiophilus]